MACVVCIGHTSAKFQTFGLNDLAWQPLFVKGSWPSRKSIKMTWKLNFWSCHLEGHQKCSPKWYDTLVFRLLLFNVRPWWWWDRATRRDCSVPIVIWLFHWLESVILHVFMRLCDIVNKKVSKCRNYWWHSKHKVHCIVCAEGAQWQKVRSLEMLPPNFKTEWLPFSTYI